MAWDRLRALQQLKFQDPAPYLKRLREVEVKVASSDLPTNVRHLRTNSLKPARELRAAALFCYGMGQRIGQTVYLAPSESQDYDFVASWVVGDSQHLAPVQLKEVVPPSLNPAASLDATIESLSKYADSRDLTVAIHLNQYGRFSTSDIRIPSLNIAALWVFGAISADQREWGLWGNFLEEPEGLRFEYPT